MTDRWWDKFRPGARSDADDPLSVPGNPASCAKCDWAGTDDRLIDHPKIEYLLCPVCLCAIPGTFRRLDCPHCPECGSARMTQDGKACLDCDWPEVEIQSEPTTENPEDLE